LTVAYCRVEFFTARSLLTLLATAIGILAVAGLLYALLQPDKAFISEGIRAKAFKGIYFDKNGGARIYAYAVLLIVGLQLYKTRFYQVLLAVLLLCILMSQSATALVIVFFGLLLSAAFNLLHSSSLQLNFLRFFLLLAGLVIGGSLIYQLYDVVLLWLGRDPTLTNRVIIWALLDPYIQAEWLRGYGFGAFWSSSAVSEFVARWGFIGNAHSGYYEALLHGGIVALVLVFIIIFHTLWRLSKHYIYSVNGHIASMLLPFVLIQVVVNYIGYLIINHNSFDMFMFSIIYFIASRGVSRRDPEQS
jgi:exopolysaccharide production protein ExoQ